MKVYFQAFVKFKQNNWARLLPMAEFIYNNAKNASTGHISFELNCGYYSHVSFEEDIDSRSRFMLASELLLKLQKLISIYCKNLFHAQKLQKRAYNKSVKPRSYTFNDKVWLNSKYIKTKQNQKLEAKFYESFQVLHPLRKQAYKLELPKKWKIHHVFHISLLEQDNTRGGK